MLGARIPPPVRRLASLFGIWGILCALMFPVFLPVFLASDHGPHPGLLSFVLALYLLVISCFLWAIIYVFLTLRREFQRFRADRAIRRSQTTTRSRDSQLWDRDLDGYP